jgi:hypothetical protein
MDGWWMDGGWMVDGWWMDGGTENVLTYFAA